MLADLQTFDADLQCCNGAHKHFQAPSLKRHLRGCELSEGSVNSKDLGVELQ